MPRRKDRVSLLAAIGPGLLVAATGVGSGDLATAGFTGSKLGVAVLWAVALGAFLKFALTEGLARWQLATGETLLEGAVTRLGRPVSAAFLLYLLPWTFFVGSALISGAGVAAAAILPPLPGTVSSRVVYGVLQSLLGVLLVEAGGFKLFEKVMSACIAVMFVTVTATAVALGPDWGAVFRGLLWPTIPDLSGQGLPWTMALIGGVGGTLTVLCYGYWIREEGRTRPEDLAVCRVDLGAGYAMTALFGMAMVVIGTRIETTGKGVNLIVALASQLDAALGPAARWAFLLGAWCAIFSSLLGVWQSVPYVFADFVRLTRGRGKGSIVDTRSWAYRGYLYALALVPMAGLAMRFERAQKLYAIVGAGFLPLLALALLVMNGNEDWVGRRLKNSPAATAVLVATLAFFGWAGWSQVRAALGL